MLDCLTGGVVCALTGEAYIQPLICMSQVRILLSAPVDIAQPGRATEEYRFANLRGRLTSPAIIRHDSSVMPSDMPRILTAVAYKLGLEKPNWLLDQFPARGSRYRDRNLCGAWLREPCETFLRRRVRPHWGSLHSLGIKRSRVRVPPSLRGCSSVVERLI